MLINIHEFATRQRISVHCTVDFIASEYAALHRFILLSVSGYPCMCESRSVARQYKSFSVTSFDNITHDNTPLLACVTLNCSGKNSNNNNNNNNNNKRICIAQVCRMTSEALDGQLQSCYTARAGPKCLTEEKCFKTTLEQS